MHVVTGFLATMGLGQTDCERIVDSALAQPVLAVTSLAFIAIGAVVVWRALRAKAVLAGVAGLTIVAVGVGSFAYHGPQPSWASLAHDAPIAAVAVVCVVGLVRSGLTARRSRWAMAAVVFALGLAVYAAGRTGSPLCRPDSLWQYHGAWHVLAAAAAGLAAWAMMPPENGRPPIQ